MSSCSPSLLHSEVSYPLRPSGKIDMANTVEATILPREIWHKIFSYLEFQDLKLFVEHKVKVLKLPLDGHEDNDRLMIGKRFIFDREIFLTVVENVYNVALCCKEFYELTYRERELLINAAALSRIDKKFFFSKLAPIINKQDENETKFEKYKIPKIDQGEDSIALLTDSIINQSLKPLNTNFNNEILMIKASNFFVEPIPPSLNEHASLILNESFLLEIKNSFDKKLAEIKLIEPKMSALCIFLNTRVEDAGAFAWIGDKNLAPFRYLFNGKTIRIQPCDSGHDIEIHRVASFKKRNDRDSSGIYSYLKSFSIEMVNTALSIVFLIPGFILGSAFKGLAYLFSDVREKHGFVKEHFTSIYREIGSASNPIKSREELQKALEEERKLNLKNQLTNALIIHGDGNLTINEDLGILQFNPMKLVLEGVRIVHEPSKSFLDDEMHFSGKRKWRIIANHVNSVSEALQVTAPRRSWASSKRYHMVFNIESSQVS